MRYNVLFYDRMFNYLHNSVAYDPLLDDDCLTIETNTIDIYESDKPVTGGYIVIQELDYIGIITELKTDEGITKVTFKTILSLVDIDVLFNTKWSTDKRALENVIKELLDTQFVSNTDSNQKLPVDISISSSTSTWKLNIDPVSKELPYAIVNLYSDVITKAVSKYGIAVRVKPDLVERRIKISVGIPSETASIDTTLPSIKVTELKYSDKSGKTNKLIIWNEKNFTESIVYYVHSDAKYDTTDSDRIVPVVQSMTSVNPSDEETFATAAKNQADSMLKGLEWDNLIEIELFTFDPLVQPLTIPFGATCTIYHKSMAYNSILTGRKIEGETCTLSYGTIRADLTKKIKMGG